MKWKQANLCTQPSKRYFFVFFILIHSFLFGCSRRNISNRKYNKRRAEALVRTSCITTILRSNRSLLLLTHKYIRKHIHTHTHIHIHTNTQIHTIIHYTHVHIYTHECTYRCTHRHGYIHGHTNIHTNA